VHGLQLLNAVNLPGQTSSSEVFLTLADHRHKLLLLLMAYRACCCNITMKPGVYFI
jgi:hypothetical protein